MFFRKGENGFLPRLRPTLLALVLGLLLITVACVGSIAFFKTSESIESLVGQQFSAVSHSIVDRVEALTSAPSRILLEFEVQARRGSLPLDNLAELGARFAERLRQNPDLAWIGYADAAEGWFVGANRRSGSTIRIYTARLDVNGGIPVEVEVPVDGPVQAVDVPETKPYRATERNWFRTGMTLNGVGWLDAYTFADGARGVSAVLPLRVADGKKPSGVFLVDMFIDTLQERLDRLTVGQTGRVHLLDMQGGRVASPTAWSTSDPTLDDAIEHMGGKSSLVSIGQGAERRKVFDEKGEGWRSAFHHISIPGGPDWIVAVVVPEHEFTGVARENALWTIAATGAGLLLAVWAAFIISRRIAEPLRIISHDLERLSAFAFDGAPANRSFVREVEVLRRSAAKMKASLQSFGRYVPTDLVRGLLASGNEAKLGGERRCLTIQFSDIEGFTSISEKLTPEQLVEELGAYFSLMREALHENEGTLDKYMGDGIMAFFNAPRPVDDHEVKACLSALDAQKRVGADNIIRRATGRPEFRTRIGLATGEVIVGNIGTPDRFAYTVIGDTVNLASRLEGMCKFYGVSITASGAVRVATGDAFEWRTLDRVAVMGRTTGTDIHELLCRKGELTFEAAKARDEYELALTDYLSGRFAEAARRFCNISQADPRNTAAEIMARRAHEMNRKPPNSRWDGIYLHNEK